MSHNKGGTTSNLCPLCRKAVETFGHVFVECEELAGAQLLMHDEITGRLLTQIASKKEGSTMYQGQAMRAIWAECKQD